MPEPLRCIFMGTPDFSVKILDALVTAEVDVVAAYSQPPRKSGRGMKQTPSPVHARAEALGIPVFTPKSLRNTEDQAAFIRLCQDVQVHVAVVVAYGLILPDPILQAPRHGCVNVHASILPRWRGAAPIQRAIAAGDSETGITFMQMDTGLDTGPMLRIDRLPIHPNETGGSLHDRLADLGATGIADIVHNVVNGTTSPQPQPTEGVTYAHKLEKTEGHMDWFQSATQIDAQLRALTPWPGAFTFVPTHTAADPMRLKILEAVCTPDAAPKAAPGTVIDDTLTVACGSGTLRITRLQKPGKGPMDTADFLRGFPIPAGTQLV